MNNYILLKVKRRIDKMLGELFAFKIPTKIEDVCIGGEDCEPGIILELYKITDCELNIIPHEEGWDVEEYRENPNGEEELQELYDQYDTAQDMIDGICKRIFKLALDHTACQPVII